MSRQIEVKVGNEWKEWRPWQEGLSPPINWPWRYVGGVLEWRSKESSDEWGTVGDSAPAGAEDYQRLTVAEATAKGGAYGIEYRLRPYEDAVEEPATKRKPASAQRGIDAEKKASRLADECGALRTERDELLRENAVLRRGIEKLERAKR